MGLYDSRVSAANPIADLRARIAPHGYALFLRPDRPAGWWVVLHGGRDRLAAPQETRVATRADALAVAERLFVNRRLHDLDSAIRDAGHRPPPWVDGSQDDQLVALERCAVERGIVV